MSIVEWINSCYYLTFIIFAYKVCNNQILTSISTLVSSL